MGMITMAHKAARDKGVLVFSPGIISKDGGCQSWAQTGKGPNKLTGAVKSTSQEGSKPDSWAQGIQAWRLTLGLCSACLMKTARMQ